MPEKLDIGWCQKLLECPATREPFAHMELLLGLVIPMYAPFVVHDCCCRDVFQVGIDYYYYYYYYIYYILIALIHDSKSMAQL